MIGFEYIYNKPSEIIEKTKLIGEFSGLEYGIFVSIFLFLLIFVYYILPYIYFSFDNFKKDFARKKRKKLIHSIAIQKDIEEEIEKELNLK